MSLRKFRDEIGFNHPKKADNLNLIVDHLKGKRWRKRHAADVIT